MQMKFFSLMQFYPSPSLRLGYLTMYSLRIPNSAVHGVHWLFWHFNLIASSRIASVSYYARRVRELFGLAEAGTLRPCRPMHIMAARSSTVRPWSCHFHDSFLNQTRPVTKATTIHSFTPRPPSANHVPALWQREGLSNFPQRLYKPPTRPPLSPLSLSLLHPFFIQPFSPQHPQDHPRSIITPCFHCSLFPILTHNISYFPFLRIHILLCHHPSKWLTGRKRKSCL